MLSIALAVPACTAGEESDGESSDSDLHVKPTDSEDLGRLTVTTPPGWVLPVNPSDDATVSYRGSTVPFNVAQRLKEGPGAVVVSSKFDSALTTPTVNVTKGASTTYALGSIKASYDPTTTLVRDFGPKPALQIFYTSPGTAELLAYTYPTQGVNATSAFWAGNTTRAVLAPPGSYRFT
ncbi:MAG TPA: hypothetical protein VIF62_01285 [Labilithrix sp.]